MAKLSVSVDVPLPPEKAWECASDLSRYKEWLTIHRLWRSKLPDTLDKGTQIVSIGMVVAAALKGDIRESLNRSRPSSPRSPSASPHAVSNTQSAAAEPNTAVP